MTQTHVNSSVDPSQTQNELRSQIGSILKDARMKAGVSIDAVAHETKISKQFIISLESGNFDQLPGQVFGRGFIKNISRYLRSDSQELLKLYDESWTRAGRKLAAPGATQETPPPLQEKSVSATVTHATAAEVQDVSSQHPTTSDIPDIKHLPSVSPRRQGLRVHVPTWLVRGALSQNTLLTILASIAAIMVIGVFGRWVASQKRLTTPAATTAEVATTAPSEADSSMARSAATADGESMTSTENLVDVNSDAPGNLVEKTIDESAVATGTSSVAETSTGPAAAQSAPAAQIDVSASSQPVGAGEESPLTMQGTPVAFEQTLELKVTSPVEIRLAVDGKKSERTTYPVGTTQLTFRDRADLIIQDASSVEITFNGKSLGSLGSKGRERKLSFQAKPTELDFPY